MSRETLRVDQVSSSNNYKSLTEKRMINLKDKVAIVTGSSKGLGKIVAEQLLKEGAKVIGWSRKDTVIDHPNFKSYSVDIGHEAKVKAAFEQVIKDHGTVDIIINNAGFGTYQTIEDTDSDTLRQMFDTNVFGIFYLTKLAVSIMKQAQSGHIINISSIAGIVGIENMSAYNATKFAVKGMSESLFKELRPHGIKVTCIMPGSISTNFFDEFEGFTASQQMMEANDVAEHILFYLKSAPSMHPVNIELRPFKHK